MKYFIFIIHSLTPFILISQTSGAEVSLKKFRYNIDKNGLAILGYDPVNYFLGSAKKGSPTYSLKHNSITYYFFSSKNLELFKTSPSKFEPMYGGWCAYAMGATGDKVEIDPETFKIVDGKLYLFYNSFFNNTLLKWNKDEKNLNKKANDNWVKINN